MSQGHRCLLRGIVTTLLAGGLLLFLSACDNSITADTESQASPPLRIATDGLPEGTVGEAYQATLEAEGGGGESHTWSIYAGELPDGLGLDTATGEIAGIPASHGTFEFTVQVAAGSVTATRALAITVIEPASIVLEISAGNDQIDWVGSELRSAISVRALGEDAEPRGGIRVEFEVTSGGGSLSASTLITNSAPPVGLAGVRWTLGPDEGRQTVVASAPGTEAVTFTATAAAPDEDGFGFVFDPGVQQAEEDEIRQGISAGAAYLRTEFGWESDRNVLVHGSELSGPSTAFAGADRVTVNVGSSVWQGTDSFHRYKILIHELFHVLQEQVGWDMSRQGTVPLWLVEGAAEFVGFKGAMIDPGVLDAETVHRCHVWPLYFSDPALGPLSDYEASIGAGPTYSLFYLAVERLLEHRDLKVLYRITDFEQAFGTTVDAFYADFASYRDGLQKPARYECNL